MNMTSSAIIGAAALLFSLNSSESLFYNVSNFRYFSGFKLPISETQKLVILENIPAWEQTMILFPNVRGFTQQEMLAYKESLSCLFKKTGRRIF
jgi:hypothetical protein